MTVSYAFWCSRRDARVMGSNSARSICRYYPAGTPPCPPYMPGCNTKIRQANFESVNGELARTLLGSSYSVIEAVYCV